MFYVELYTQGSWMIVFEGNVESSALAYFLGCVKEGKRVRLEYADA